MKKGAMMLATILLTLLLTGCGVANHLLNEESSLHLYYPTELGQSQGGDAIDSVSVNWQTIPQDDRQAQATEILRLLMEGCGEKEFRSPIPAGTVLQDCTISGSTVHVDFSAAYGQLSGIDLTVADYCVALSLTQIPGIYAVQITVMGQELDYRDKHQFMASDVLLTATEDVVRTLATRLYFPDEEGKLVAEDRLLMLYEGETRAGVIVNGLLSGPESEGLQPLVPEGFTVLSVRVEERICYLNLPRSQEDLLARDGEIILQGFASSLRELEDVDEVWLFLDGEFHTRIDR